LYDLINIGYHLNKKHWNRVTLLSDVDDALLKELMYHYCELVYDKLTNKQSYYVDKNKRIFYG